MQVRERIAGAEGKGLIFRVPERGLGMQAWMQGGELSAEREKKAEDVGSLSKEKV